MEPLNYYQKLAVRFLNLTDLITSYLKELTICFWRTSDPTCLKKWEGYRSQTDDPLRTRQM